VSLARDSGAPDCSDREHRHRTVLPSGQVDLQHVRLVAEVKGDPRRTETPLTPKVEVDAVPTVLAVPIRAILRVFHRNTPPVLGSAPLMYNNQGRRSAPPQAISRRERRSQRGRARRRGVCGGAPGARAPLRSARTAHPLDVPLSVAVRRNTSEQRDEEGVGGVEPRALRVVAGLLMAAAAAEFAPHERQTHFASQVPEPTSTSAATSHGSQPRLGWRFGS
jgi:hypothetical protein